MSTILLVDDEAAILDLYSYVLELMGHRVLRARDGEQALELAQSQRPDLVVTDWMMPRMNGVELCGALTQDEAFQGVPIILHSASGNPQAPGVFAFLPKSGELKRFEEAVTQALAASSQGRSGAPPHGCCASSGGLSGWARRRCT
jgi:CheY-like chemotaxis protein